MLKAQCSILFYGFKIMIHYIHEIEPMQCTVFLYITKFPLVLISRLQFLAVKICKQYFFILPTIFDPVCVWPMDKKHEFLQSNQKLVLKMFWSDLAHSTYRTS